MSDIITRGETLAAAARAVNGDRDRAYGSPEDSFCRIAGLWSAAFDRNFTPEEVAIALALLKIARLTSDPSHQDSWVDLAGYAACGSEVSPPTPERTLPFPDPFDPAALR